MMKKAIFLTMLSAKMFAFEESPWLDFPYQFNFRPSLIGSYYSSINHAVGSVPYEHSFNEELDLNLGVVSLSQVELQAEMQLFQTKATQATLESAAVQIRSQMMDDIEGDPLSLTIGALIRFVPDHALRDPYTPYHQLVNFEANAVIGKEFDQVFDWVKRMYLFTGIGIANKGAPWLRFKAVTEIHRSHHLFGAMLKGYFGFGSERDVVVNDFHGYASIAHESLDLGLIYRYVFDIWGTLSVELAYRVMAFSFPQNYTSLEIRYCLPFSLF